MLETTPREGTVEATEPSRTRGTTQPMATLSRPEGEAGTAQPAVRVVSYHPSRWPIVNKALDITDTVTGGRAGVIQRVVNYLTFGGTAAVVNLVLLTYIYYYVALPVLPRIHYAIAFALATEVSIVVNFIPQDRVTFRHLPGHSRSWLMRCGRFHVTSIGGILVTAIVSFTMREVVGLHATLAQAIAIVVALFFNFTFHHVFTYRHAKPQVL